MRLLPKRGIYIHMREKKEGVTLSRRFGIIVLITIGLILVCSYSYVAPYLDLFVGLFSDPLWVTVFVTVALVGINIFYAVQTRQTIKEMEKARKAEFMPHLRAELVFLGPVFLLLRMTNVGKGPAIAVKARISFAPSDETRQWKQETVPPDESIRIFLPDGSLEKVCETAAEIYVKGEYLDLFGKQFKIDEEIDTKQFIDNMKQLKQIIDPDVPRIIRGLKDELRDIKTTLRDIKRCLRQDD